MDDIYDPDTGEDGPFGEEEGLEEGRLLGAEDEGCLARTGWKER